MVPTTRLRGRYSCRWQQVSAQSRVTWSPVLRPEPITKQLLHFVLSLLVQVIRLRYTSTDLIYRGSSSLLCGGKFHFCCGTTVSCICVWCNTTAFSCYGFHFIYMHALACCMQLRKTTQHGCVFYSVIVLFILLWKLHFLHMCWT